MKFRRFLKESSAEEMRIKNWLDKMGIKNYTINPDLTVDVAGDVDLMRIKKWLDKMGIENYTINPDLTVDVDGDVDLIDVGLTEIPVQFGVVGGSFYCDNNQLTSLEGAPREVVGSFDCENNQLTSLQGAPEKIKGWFDCSKNQLTSLEGAPREVGRSFGCKNNKRKFTEEEVIAVCEVGWNIYV